jgi:hypothetical protein
VLIDYTLDDKRYIITSGDFDKVKEFCENDCMGIKFLMNARFLKKLVKILLKAGFKPPYTNDSFKSLDFKDFLEQNGMMRSMKRKFGIDDVELVTKIVIKSTYNFLHKE